MYSEYYLTFNEVCKRFKLSEHELQVHILEENITPAIFYFLHNDTPDQHVFVDSNGQRRVSHPRTDIPKQPELSYQYDVVYLLGALRDVYPLLYKFAYVALTPKQQHFRTEDSSPVPIYTIPDMIPYKSDDAKEHFIFAIEEVERLEHLLPKEKKSRNEKRREILHQWLKLQHNDFDPFNHKITKKEVYSDMNKINSKICNLIGDSSLNDFFQGKKGFRGCKDLIKFTTKARMKK